jgi:dipeptidase D
MLDNNIIEIGTISAVRMMSRKEDIANRDRAVFELAEAKGGAQ